MSANIECMETIQLTEKEKEVVTKQKRKLLARNILAAGIIFFYHSSGHILGSIQMPKLF